MIIPISNRNAQIEEYYFSKKLKEVRKMQERGIQVLNIGIGSPDIPVPEVVRQRLQREAQLDSSHGYQAYRGIATLRKAMADYYSRYLDCSLNPETEVLPLMGSKEGIMHISMAFLNPGDEVLVPDPGYPSYRAAARLAGAEVRSYDLNEDEHWQLSIEDIRGRIHKNTKIIWLNYPHMPTGAHANPKVLEQIVSLANERGILLVNDNPYGFILNKDRISLLGIPGAKRCSLELNSLSKSHGMPGWRVGMLMGAKPYIDAVLRFKSNMDSGMFRPIQEAAVTALQMEASLFDTNDRIYVRRREIIYELLDKIGFRYTKDTAGLFVWSKVSEPFKDGEEASDFFLHRCQVFVPPGIVFGKNGSQYVRWSLCSDMETLREAVSRIQDKLCSLAVNGVLCE